MQRWLGGYTGYAEWKAQDNYGMFLHLSTTYPNGGWMYFKSDNDDYMHLSGSDNKETFINIQQYVEIWMPLGEYW